MSDSLEYALAVMAAPYARQANHTALAFANALVAAGHRLQAVFFYQEGVLSGSQLMAPPQNERHIVSEWQALARAHEVRLLVCVAAGLRRGVIDEREAERHGLAGSSLGQHFELAGLGQLVHLSTTVDRLVTFA